jgi:prevent-host-death family protein
MDVSVRELRNHTARVIAAIEAGEPVVLTKHGRPVADITPRATRSETRPMAVVFRELRELQAQFAEERAEGEPPPAETDEHIDYTSDDFVADLERKYAR